MELIVKILLTLVEINVLYLFCAKASFIDIKKHPFLNVMWMLSFMVQVGIVTYLIWR